MITVFLLLSGGLISKTVIQGFSDIERETELNDAFGVIYDLETQAMNLANECGTMDESVDFIRTHNTGFLEANLNSNDLQLFNIHLAAFFDLEGRYIGGVWNPGIFSSIEGESSLIPESIRKSIKPLKTPKPEQAEATFASSTIPSACWPWMLSMVLKKKNRFQKARWSWDNSLILNTRNSMAL